MSISYTVERAGEEWRGLAWDTDEETGRRLCVGIAIGGTPAIAIHRAELRRQAIDKRLGFA